MGRALRTDVADYIYHVLNRANGRSTILKKDADYKRFEKVLEEAKERTDMRILAYCVMPNHWHLVIQPRTDGDIAKFVGWLTLTHTQRHHAAHKTTGGGHLYQGRYKSFLCEDDDHFLTLVRYVERNAKRAKLVRRAEDWQWSSVWRREKGTAKQKKLLDSWPRPVPTNFLKDLNTPLPHEELEAIRNSINRGNPYGTLGWSGNMIRKFGLETTVTPRGRPKKGS